jgi:hypothetical protein
MVLTGVVLLGAPVAIASSTFKWSGGDTKTSRRWSDSSNWEGGATPSSSEPVALEFPMLTSASCTVALPTDTCYESETNVNGLSVEALYVEDSQTYLIAGKPITLGSGGLAAAPATNTTEQIGSILTMPIALGGSHADGDRNGDPWCDLRERSRIARRDCGLRRQWRAHGFLLGTAASARRLTVECYVPAQLPVSGHPHHHSQLLR